MSSQLPLLAALLCLLLPGAAPHLQAAADLQVTTFAGLAGAPGQADGTGATARFSLPYGVAVDSSGKVYVADTHNHTIRAITPARNVSTLAGLPGNPGSADGPGASAQFNQPYGVAVDTLGTVYVADTLNHTIRQITPAGVVSTLAGLAGNSGSADGPTNIARFSLPKGVAVDTSGNVYVADQGNHTIRKITPGGAVSTLAGLAGQTGSADGTNSTARFFYPDGLAVDSLGTVYVADTANHTIRKITPAGIVSTLAGLAGNSGSADGTNGVARFFYPDGLVVDTSLNVYVADTANHTLRQISPAGAVTTLAGLAGNSGSSDGPAGAAQFNYLSGVAVDTAGNLFVADTSNDTIREGIFSSSPLPTRIIGLLGDLAFGEVLVGQTATRTLTITNSGDAPLNVSAIGYPAGFSGTWSGSLPPGASTNVTVTFAPNAATTYSGLVTVTSDATAGINTLSTSGTGIPLPTRIIGLSGSLGFGPVQVGHTASRTLTLTNSGTSPLTVSNINYPAAFSGAWSGSIPPSSSQNVTVTFAPNVVADYSGNLSVTSDATAGTSAIAVSGAGIPVLLLQLTGMSVSNGSPRFVLNSPVGSNYVIQASSNLVNWVPLSTNLIPASGFVNIVDPTPANQPRRFYRAVPQASLPVLAAYWTFNEGTSTTAADSISTNTVTLRTGATWGSGKFGSALSLDGLTGRADAANGPSVDLQSNTMSVAAWVKLSSTTNWQQIVVKVKEVGAFTPPYFSWHLFGADVASSTQWRPQFQAVTTGDVSVNVSSAVNVNYGEWVHVVGVYDGSAVRIYVNGVEQGSAAQIGNLVSYSQPLYIGATGLPDQFAKGLIDEVRVYSQALSAAQVLALYGWTTNAPVPANLRMVAMP